MERTILHSDCNCFYAAVEMLHHPEYDGQPLAVGGDKEKRHGIILTANYIAKHAGVKTGMALWQAKQVCPELVIMRPHMDLYLRFSRLINEIYAEYTDLREPFGIDETWLDVTASASLKGDGIKIADEISSRVKKELGITVSIGVSWNKIFAKLGSDYKKPDAITLINRENYKTIVWPLPASDLLYVGRATKRKLRSIGIRTIGELALADPALLKMRLGKMGLILSVFANGNDRTPVSPETAQVPVKSIGNSTTTVRDLVCDEDAAIVLYVLAESVAKRLRENNLACRVVEIWVRDNDLCGFVRQQKLELPTNITNEIAEAGIRLFKNRYDWSKPLRSIGIRGADLTDPSAPVQLSLFSDEGYRDKLRRADIAVDDIRRRFGYGSIRRGLMHLDRELSSLNAAEDNIVHPHGYFERGNRTGAEEYETFYRN